jgi:predicted permease
MDVLRQDFAFALRLLRRDKAFAIAVILTLGVCLGANTAIFTVVRSVLLRPLPYPESDRLVLMYDGFPGAGVERAGVSVPNHYDRVALAGVLDSAALYRWNGKKVGEGAKAEGVSSMDVSPSFFKVLRTNAVRGRLFMDADGEVGKEHVVLLSYAFAVKQGGIDAVVGKQLRLDTVPYTVVGVLPQDFVFLSKDVRLYVPLAFKPEDLAEQQRYSQNHEEIGRLAPGATIGQLQSRLDALNAGYIERAGALKTDLINVRYYSKAVSLQADLVRNVRSSLTLLWGGVLFVLLIAGVNITNLALVRANGRMKELATRTALGAGRSRVVRQLVTETLVLTACGAAVGLLIGYWSVDSLSTFAFTDLPRSEEVRFDGTVVAFIAGLAALLGLVIGAVPALHLKGISLSLVLRDSGRTGTASRQARYVRRGLAMAQVALAFVLLVGAGLLLASFRQLLGVNPGFQSSNILTGRTSPLVSQYPDDAAVRSYAARALDEIRRLPGIEGAGITTNIPFGWDDSSSVIVPEGHVKAPGESVVSPRQVKVTPGYFEALRVPLKKGRFFTASDDEKAPRVIILDERLATLFWPKADPIGRRVYLPKTPDDVAKPGPDVTWLQVVGIVGSMKMKGLVEGVEESRSGAYYFPLAQDVQRNLGFVIRTARDPATLTPSVQRVLTTIDPEMQMSDVFTMAERVDKSLNPRRTPMQLSLAFSVVALLLASIGIYGVLAYQVSQRTREIGIRMALGSDQGRVIGLVLREGLVLVAAGLVAGLAGAVALRQAIASQLYNVGALDPVVILAVTGVLAVTSLVACFGPARRAAKVSPVVALSEQ